MGAQAMKTVLRGGLTADRLIIPRRPGGFRANAVRGGKRLAIRGGIRDGDIITDGLILRADFRNNLGSFVDPFGNTITCSNSGWGPQGQNFDGNDDYATAGTPDIQGDRTVEGWAFNKGFGEGQAARLFSNGQFEVYYDGQRLAVTSDGGVTVAYSAALSVPLYEWARWRVTRPSDGDNANIYIGSLTSAPALSGAANQDTGTPGANGVLYFGNRAANDCTHFGWMDEIHVYDRITATGEGYQNWAATKGNYRDPVNLLTNWDFEDGDPPTDWAKTGDNYSQDAVTFYSGSKSLKVERVTSFTMVYQYVPWSNEYRGKTVLLGAWVNCATPTRAVVNIYDGKTGSDSSYHPGSSQFAWLSVTKTLAADATQLRATMVIANAAAAAYYDSAILTTDTELFV